MRKAAKSGFNPSVFLARVGTGKPGASGFGNDFLPSELSGRAYRIARRTVPKTKWPQRFPLRWGHFIFAAAHGPRSGPINRV